MQPIQDREFSYTIQPQRLQSGKLIWVWEVRKTCTGSILDRGATTRSRDAARSAVLAVISDAQSSDRPHMPSPW
jgi:hypothetical protein